MKRALIIGATGFVGNYLVKELLVNHDMEIHVTKLPKEQLEVSQNEYNMIHNLDILNRDDIANILYEIRPDYIFHLAAQSSVSIAWKNPGLTVDVNIKGSINVMEAIREMFYKPKVLLIGSGEEYGHILENEIPISEESRLRPGNIYAATKVCQNMIGNIYSRAFNMDVMMVRAFNHIGPGQSSIFVVSDFCRQVAEIEAGLKKPVMYVGNLEVKRDFTDVRDIVRAYALLIKTGSAGETYNVGSGHSYTIREVLDEIISLSSEKIKVEIDMNKIRPVDVPIIEADITKINQITGWKPLIPLRQTLQETLDYWRARV